MSLSCTEEVVNVILLYRGGCECHSEVCLNNPFNQL